MPRTVLDANDTAVNKRDKIPHRHKAYVLMGRQAIHMISKLYDGSEGDKCCRKQQSRVRGTGKDGHWVVRRALVKEVPFEQKYERNEGISQADIEVIPNQGPGSGSVPRRVKEQ